MSKNDARISVTALQLERAVIPWVAFDAEAEVLACTPTGKPRWIPSSQLAKSDLCLQEIPVSQGSAKHLDFDEVIEKSEAAACAFLGRSIDVGPEFAALVGLVSATFMTRMSKKTLDEDTVIVLRECFPDMSIEKQLELVVRPGLEQAGFCVHKVTKLVHNKLRVAGVSATNSTSIANPIALFRNNTGRKLFQKLMTMDSPIPEALLYGVLLRSASLQRTSKGKAALVISGIRPEYFRDVMRLFWMFRTCPAATRPKSNLLMQIYQHDVAAAFATDEFNDLSASIKRFRHAMLAQEANNRRQFVDYKGKTYVVHRIQQIRHGETISSHASDSAVCDYGFEVLIRKGEFIGETDDLTKLTLSTRDHRNRKSKEREQHLRGTFAPKRSIDKPSQYYQRVLRDEAIGDCGVPHAQAVLHGDCQILTPYASILAKDIAVGDCVLNGCGQPVTVRKVITHEVDEDFCDILTHHMGHLLVAQSTQVKILPGIARGFSKEDLLPSGKNAHLRVSYPCDFNGASWQQPATISKPSWVPIPKPVSAIMSTSDLPVIDLAQFVDERDTVPKLGRTRFTIMPNEVIWHCYKSFKGHEYDGFRMSDVELATGVPRSSLRDIVQYASASKDATVLHGYDKVATYLHGLGVAIVDWANMVKSPIDIAMPRQVNMSEPLAYLVGFYIADGTAANGCVGFALDKSKPEEESLIRSAMSAAFPYTSARIQDYNKGQGYMLNYSNPILEALFKHFVPDRLYEKKVPDWMMRMPDNLALALLKGLIDGDGSTKNSRVSYAGASYHLVYQVRNLLMRFGVPARCSYSHIRSRLGKMSVVMMLDAPITDIIREMFSLPDGQIRQTLADEDGGCLIASYQKTDMFHHTGTAYSFVLEEGDEMATAAGIIRLTNPASNE